MFEQEFGRLMPGSRDRSWASPWALAWGHTSAHPPYNGTTHSEVLLLVSQTQANFPRPWVFHINAMLLAVVCLLCFFTHESRPSVLLSRRIKAVQKSTACNDLWADNKDKVPDLRTFANTMLLRPTVWFFTEPIVCTVSIMSGVIFASVYLQTEGLTVTYEAFGFSERQASLVFFTWIIGLTLTIPLRLNDWRLVTRRLRNNEEVRPEDKIVGFYVAAPTLAVALWWFSWTVPPVVSQHRPHLRTKLPPRWLCFQDRTC